MKLVVRLVLKGEQNLLMPANLGRVLLQLCHYVLKIHTDEYKMIHEFF